MWGLSNSSRLSLWKPFATVGYTLTHLETDVNSSDLISVDDATEEYSISRSTIFRLFKQGLSRYRRPGDRKTYVSRRQLEELTSFREVE